MLFARQTLTIAVKDLRAELRTKEAINSAFSFALVILLLFSFAFDPTSELTREFSGGLLWMSFAFAGALILNRSFARELPNDCLDALVASPVSSAALFLGKTIANWCLLVAVELFAFPVFAIFYNVTWPKQSWVLLLVIVLGTWGVTIIGTLFSALTVNIRLREVMLPMLVYPILIPCLMAAMQLTVNLLAGEPLAESMYWMKFLVGFDVIFTSLAVVLIETVLVG
jgi:heme exporter protein B